MVYVNKPEAAILKKPYLNSFNSLVTQNNKFNWLYSEVYRENFHEIWISDYEKFGKPNSRL